MTKPNDLDLQIEIAEQELEVAKENLNQIQQHLFLLKAERDQRKERKNVDWLCTNERFILQTNEI